MKHDVTGVGLCAKAASDLQARADGEADLETARILRAVAGDLDAGRADPVSASATLLAAARACSAHATRFDALHAAAESVKPRALSERLIVGGLRAERLAAFFGWRIVGHGYPSEGATFEVGGLEFDVTGNATAALLAHVYAA